MYVCEYKFLMRPEVLAPLGSGDGCKSPDVDTEAQTWALWKAICPLKC